MRFKSEVEAVKDRHVGARSTIEETRTLRSGHFTRILFMVGVFQQLSYFTRIVDTSGVSSRIRCDRDLI